MHVLIIDDDPITCVTLKSVLAQCGHTAQFVGDGCAALTQLDAPGEPLPDVLVLDWITPGMTGDEFLQRLAVDARWRDIPVIVATAVSIDERAHLWQRWPRVRVLGKPYEPDELLGVLKGLEVKATVGERS